MAQTWNYFNNSYGHAFYFIVIYSCLAFWKDNICPAQLQKTWNYRAPEANHHDSTNCPTSTATASPLLTGQLMGTQRMWIYEPRKIHSCGKNLWHRQDLMGHYIKSLMTQNRSKFENPLWINPTDFSKGLLSTAHLGKSIGLLFMLHWFKTIEHMTVSLKCYSRGYISSHHI